MPDEEYLTPVANRQLLRCHTCGFTAEIAHVDLLKYISKGWPICCGEVMAYYRESKRPSYLEDDD